MGRPIFFCPFQPRSYSFRKLNLKDLKLYNSIPLLVVAIAFLAVASACFTGIESTPKITSENVRESGVRITNEQIFASKIVPQPPAQWEGGKMWLVADPKISLTFTSASDAASPIPGDTLRLINTRLTTTLTGNQAIELVLSSNDGRLFFHRTGFSQDDWLAKKFYNIPFAIELSAVELADSLMEGKTYFVSTPRWFDSEGRDVMGQRHVPVTVLAVKPGNHLYPLLVAFSQNDRPSEPVRYILMTYGDETSATRNFDRLFSFSNPRKIYPNITDQTWDKIINSQIAEGMTREECRLALGAPASIDRAATPGAQLERWTYENGVYLLFEDGYLTKFRM